MPARVLSRRAFLAATGLGAAALLGCDVADVPASITPIANPPKKSPFVIGPYQVGQVILGEDPGTKALPQPFKPGELDVGGSLPSSVLAAVYFPYFAGTDHRVPTPNPLHVTKGPFPVLLYAHAFRQIDIAAPGATDPKRDFTSVDAMMRHVASYGCVCIVPDLSWIQDVGAAGPTLADAFAHRARVLTAYYQYVASSLNDTLFAQQVDLSRVILVGHSRGGGSAVQAGRDLSATGLQPVATGLIAPEAGANTDSGVRNLVVLGGSLDGDENAQPEAAYNASGTPKTLVTIPGANHFGYTGICPLDNTCYDAGLFDENGTISRAAQQQTGAAYLTALVRFYALGDSTVRPYLTGEERVEGLEVYGVTGIQVQAQGLPLSTPTPSMPTPGQNKP